MRCRRALALLLAAGMLCSGCSTGAISSNYRPVEDLELIQTIGVDRAPEGVCLSAATGKAGEGEAPKRMTQSGVSMLAALDQLQDRRAPSCFTRRRAICSSARRRPRRAGSRRCWTSSRVTRTCA